MLDILSIENQLSAKLEITQTRLYLVNTVHHPVLGLVVRVVIDRVPVQDMVNPATGHSF